MLSNADVAKKLLEIRLLMELAGESFYKYTAFEKAAASIENAAPIADVIAAGELLKLPGIGKSIGVVVEQLVQTGRADALDELFVRYPPSILEVLGVSGIGTKTAATLFESYGIASLADLERAIDSGVLDGAPRLGLSDGRSHVLIGTVPPQHMYGFESTVLLALVSALPPALYAARLSVVAALAEH